MREIFRLSTFRLSLLSIPLNVLAGLLVLGFVYWNTISLMDVGVDRAIGAERERILEHLPSTLSAQREFLGRTIDNERGSARFYMLTDGRGRPLVANFTLEEDAALPGDGDFAARRVIASPAGRRVPVRLHAVTLPSGGILVIGRDMSEASGFRVIVEESLGLAMVLAVLLGTVFGLVTSRTVLRRLSLINNTARRILRGRLEERMPLVGSGDEFDRLARNLNAMLDRIAELMAATREVTDNIAHDLRGPLNRMRGRLELAMLPGATREDVEQAVGLALEDSDTLLATFEALLMIARLEHGIAPDFAPVGLGDLVEDLFDYFAPLAEEKGLDLELARSDPGCVVAGDKHLLFQAFSNLVDNAIRYTPEGGRIAISLRREGATAVVAVADTGPGIPAGMREKVLRRFVRLDTSRGDSGSGLGLSVVAAIARHHGARLEMADNHPGLRVALSVPLAGGQAAT